MVPTEQIICTNAPFRDCLAVPVDLPNLGHLLPDGASGYTPLSLSKYAEVARLASGSTRSGH